MEKKLLAWFIKDRCAKVAAAYEEITGCTDASFINIDNFKLSTKSLKTLQIEPPQFMCARSKDLYRECGGLLEITCTGCSLNKHEMMLTVAVIQRLLYPVVSLSIVKEVMQSVDISRIRRETVKELQDLVEKLQDADLDVLIQMYIQNRVFLTRSQLCDVHSKEMKICSALKINQKKCKEDPVAVVDMLLEQEYFIAVSTFLCEWLHGRLINSIELVAKQLFSALEKWVFYDFDIPHNIIFCIHALGCKIPFSDSSHSYRFSYQQHLKNEQINKTQDEVCSLQSQPQSLQHWCRIMIRSAVTHDTCMSTAVKTLPVPGSMKKYLMMDEYRVEPGVALVQYKEEHPNKLQFQIADSMRRLHERYNRLLERYERRKFLLVLEACSLSRDEDTSTCCALNGSSDHRIKTTGPFRNAKSKVLKQETSVLHDVTNNCLKVSRHVNRDRNLVRQKFYGDNRPKKSYGKKTVHAFKKPYR